MGADAMGVGCECVDGAQSAPGQRCQVGIGFAVIRYSSPKRRRVAREGQRRPMAARSAIRYRQE